MIEARSVTTPDDAIGVQSIGGSASSFLFQICEMPVAILQGS